MIPATHHPSTAHARPVIVRPMTTDVLRSVCALHVQAFAQSASGRLGARYARQFMSWFLNRKDAIALVAVEEGTEGTRVQGYVIGAPVGYVTALNRSLAGTGMLAMITHPWMLLNARVWTILWARVRFASGVAPSAPIGLPAPVMSLVGIAVAPAARGTGVGLALMRAFEERARALQMASVRLSVYPDNVAARRLYEQCGWSALPQEASASGAIYYGRQLR